MDLSPMTRALRALALASLILLPFSFSLAQDSEGDPDPCEARCQAGAEEIFFSAKRLGATDEQAQARADAFYESCQAGCADVPPDDVPCATRCAQVYEQMMERIRVACADPEDEVAIRRCRELRAQASEQYEACLKACRQEPPEPPEPATCEESCEARAEAALARCVQDCPEGDEDCAMRCKRVREFVLAACALACAGESNPCAAECAKAAALAFEGCDDPDPAVCREKANAVLAECLRQKCQEPEPPTCAERCEAAHAEWVARCGEDEDCKAAAAAFLATCQERCQGGEPPEEPPCTSPCDRMRAAIEEMCGRLTDSPERCAALVAEFETLCANELGDACAADARVKASGFARFMRGDVARNRRVDIADAVAILMGLFQDDPRVLECEDASDANDDGDIDIGDAVTVLDHLFGGSRPLPSPAGVLGLDASADALGCEREDAQP